MEAAKLRRHLYLGAKATRWFFKIRTLPYSVRVKVGRYSLLPHGVSTFLSALGATLREIDRLTVWNQCMILGIMVLLPLYDMYTHLIFFIFNKVLYFIFPAIISEFFILFVANCHLFTLLAHVLMQDSTRLCGDYGTNEVPNR